MRFRQFLEVADPSQGSAYSAADRRELAKTHPMFNCTDCGENVSKLGEYHFMLLPELWRELTAAKPADKLCVGCIEARLGRKLNRDDFNWHVPITGKRTDQSERLRDRMATPAPE